MTDRHQRKRNYRYWLAIARRRKRGGSRIWMNRWVMALLPPERRNKPMLIIYRRVKSHDGITSVENTRIPNPDYVPCAPTPTS